MPHTISGSDQLISVIIPTYNRAEWVLKAMESVYAQSYRPIELIVADDGSTDDTKNRVIKWMNKKSDARFLANYLFQKNRGAPSARNTGLRESTGQYIQFLDSDCILHPEKFDIQMQLLKDKTCHYTYCRTDFRDASDTTRYTCGGAPEKDFLLNVVSENFTCIAPLWRKTALMNIFWDEDLVCRQDWIFKIRVLLNSTTGIYLDQCLCTAILHEDDRISSHDSAIFISGHETAIQRAYSIIQVRPKNRHALNYLSGKMLSIFKSYLKISDIDKAGNALLKSIEMAPGFKIKSSLIRLLWNVIGPAKSILFFKAIRRL